jgi:4-amino-4-deoxy-L-arabinose transferase-like glycosyltransferase
VLAAVLAAGATCLVCLAIGSPQPYGYVYDFYHLGVKVVYDEGRLPTAEDCWVCSYPPVFYAAGWPFYALGHWSQDVLGVGNPVRILSLLPLLCGGSIIWFGARLLTLLDRRGWDLVLGVGLLASFPCLLISSYGVEADIVLAAVMVVFTYYCVRWWRRDEQGAMTVLRLGVLAGLAIATKYQGVAAVATVAVLFAIRFIASDQRRRVAALGLLFLVTAFAIGGWKYVDNQRRYGTPTYGNSVGERTLYIDRYELASVRPRSLLRLWGPDPPNGMLTNQPVYRSVPTTLYAQAWTDMTFFSNPTRHGDLSMPYPERTMPRGLVVTVLALGLVPTALTAVGLVASLPDRRQWPLAALAATSWAAYAYWVVSQPVWGLKTKYLLFLAPVYVAWALVGLDVARRRAGPLAGMVLFGALGATVVVADAYVLQFALGGP